MIYCPRCGNQNPNGATRCQACGVQFAAAPQRPPMQQGYQQGYQQQGYQPAPAGYAQKPASVPGKGLGIASMVCGIVSFFVFGIVLGILAVVFGAMAKNKGYTGGMATTGLVLGCVGLGLSILMIFACGGMGLFL